MKEDTCRQAKELAKAMADRLNILVEKEKR